MQRAEIIARVRAYCEQETLLAPYRSLRLAAAVSGGADSMALLLVLRALQPEYGYELSVCHVNHGLRGASADRDEAFVREACMAWGIPLRAFHAAEMKETVGAVPPCAGEDWARRLRYACFERLRQEGIDAIATAHTENDQAETLLFRLARGTGLHGAAGIRPKRGCYLRPLLCLTRQQTEALCHSSGQTWVTDETNDTDAYARNRLRRSALPALQSTNDAAVENLARFCEKAARADAYFVAQAQQLLANASLSAAQPGLPAGARYALAAQQPVWRLEPLAAADELILETTMHALTAPVRDAEEKYVRLLCGLVRRGSGAVQLTDRVRLCAEGGFLWQEKTQKREVLPLEQPFLPQHQAEYPLPQGGIVEARLILADFQEKIQVVHKKDLKNQADYDRITTLYPALTLRSRQPGDRFRPAGKTGSKPLRKWMNEVGIPPSERQTLPLLASGSEVVWVSGAGFAQGLAPDAATGRILELDHKKAEEKL